MEEKLCNFYHFSDSKNHWKEKYSPKILFQEMSLKKGDFVNFLSQKI